MDGVLPMSFAFGAGEARLVGAEVRRSLIDVVRPALGQVGSQIGTMARSLVDVGRETLWLQSRSHVHLHQIIDAINALRGSTIDLSMHTVVLGGSQTVVLMAILAALDRGLSFQGTFTLAIAAGSLGDFLERLSLLKLLGLLGILALALALIVAFLYGVGLALGSFSVGAIAAAVAVAKLVLALTPLIEKLAGYDWKKLASIAVGFLLIGLFVFGLGKAFNAFRSDLAKITAPLDVFFTGIGKLIDKLTAIDWKKLANIGIGFLLIGLFVFGLGKAFDAFRSDLAKITAPLDVFFTGIGKLMDKLTAIDWRQLANIGIGFLLIGLFVFGLGKAFDAFRSDLAKITAPLDVFFTGIGKLMDKLTAIDWRQLANIGIGFLLIGLFVYGLGKAFNAFRSDLAEIIGPLDQFLQIIGALMDKFAGFGLGQMLAIVVGLAAIALFVFGLATALNTLNAQAVAAIPALVQLLGMLALLAGMFAAMSGGQLGMMALGLLAVVVFVWLLAAALMFAAGPLASIATIFASVATIIDQVTALVKGFIELLSSIGNLISGLFGSGGKVEAQITHATSLASDAKQTITAVPGTIRPLSLGVPSLPAAPQLPAMGQMPATPALPGLPAGMPKLAGGIPSLGGAGGAGLAPSAAGAQNVDQSVKVDGGINVNIKADKLEADSAQLLSDDLVQQLQRRLTALRSDQDFRVGARPAAPA